jgi:hydroxymethylglutaryl-CoA synthase
MNTKVGIEAIAYDFPKLGLTTEEFSAFRGMDKDKLIKGLGIQQFAFPDLHQDAVVLAANALTRLLEDNKIHVQRVQKLYVGTESAVDSAKPIGSYLHTCLQQKPGMESIAHWDTVDFTFACIGAVDALQACLDYIRLNPEHQAIVVATDFAKYDLRSPGEYTQGAGSIALLLSANPKVLVVEPQTGVSTQGVFDFFKPRRILSKQEVLINNQDPWVQIEEEEVKIFKDQPVFDGAYSQQCYMARTQEAYFRLKEKLDYAGALYERWDAILMHLPYCYQARRSFVEIFAKENTALLSKQPGENLSEKTRSLYKSEEYQGLIQEKIQEQEFFSGSIGNIYTGSIFLALLGYLYHALKKNKNPEKIGFLAYGSGSKSKAFEGTFVEGWKKAVQAEELAKIGQAQYLLSFEEYESLHKGSQQKSILKPNKEWILKGIEDKIENKKGARYYEWVD